jgi:tetratricopeptide (TPR) repeat protein
MAVDNPTMPVTRPRRVLLRYLFFASPLLVASLLAAGWYANVHYRLPKQQLALAERALAGRDFGEARLHLQKCLEAWPNDPRVHFLMARTARRAGDLDLAEEHLTRCQHLQNDRPDPNLGDTRLEWALIEAQRGNLADVDAFLRRRIREDHPDSLLILETMSWELMGRNRLQEALLLLNAWLDKQPGDYEAVVRRGWVYEHLFARKEAVTAYRAALEIRPERDNVRQRLVELLSDANRNGEALEEATELVRRKPDDPSVQVCYARCLRAQGQPEQAVQVLDQVLARQPEHAAALALRAQMAFDSGQYEGARGLLVRASAADPGNRQPFYTLSLCLKRLNRPQEAKAVEARMAKLEADLRRVDTLVRHVNERPNDVAARYEIGTTFLHYGMTDDGLHWLSTVLELDPNHQATHQALAYYYERVGDKEQAAWHRQFFKQE